MTYYSNKMPFKWVKAVTYNGMTHHRDWLWNLEFWRDLYRVRRR